VHSHQATPDDVQLRSPWVNAHQATRGDVRRLGGADLGAGGRGFESRHPGHFSNMLATCGSQSGSQLLSQANLNAGVAGSACPPGIADELVDQMLSMTSRTSTRSMVTAVDG
jgi:hypothetical protein